VAYVKCTFKKTISSATARRYLHQLRFRRKRPRKHFAKANPEAQQAFAQALAHIEQLREPGSVTVYMDQGRIWPDALPRLGWFVRGQPAWVDSTSPLKRDKLLFYVAVVRPLGWVITRLCTWFTPETTAQFLAKVRRCTLDRLGQSRVVGQHLLAGSWGVGAFMYRLCGLDDQATRRRAP